MSHNEFRDCDLRKLAIHNAPWTITSTGHVNLSALLLVPIFEQAFGMTRFASSATGHDVCVFFGVFVAVLAVCFGLFRLAALFTPLGLKHMKAGFALAVALCGNVGVCLRKLMSAFAVRLDGVWMRQTRNTFTILEEPRLALRVIAEPTTPTRFTAWRLVSNDVVFGERVSVATRRLIHSMLNAVQASRQSVQMAWADTGSILARMMHVVAVWNGADEPLIRNAVRSTGKLMVNHERAVTHRVFASSPFPASGFRVELEFFNEPIKQRPFWSSCSHVGYLLMVKP